ncbi:MAG: hypothetical protein HYV07_24755 [Deltaproteobacteria bacterium]|nr:hypothetical protein [Deltaproteobacteria bacterium]
MAKITFTAALLLGLGAGDALAANLTGTVVDENDSPIPSVVVRAGRVPPGSSPVTSAEFVLTGEDGTFSVPSPAQPGEYVYISFGKARYEITSGMLDLSAGGLNLGRIRMAAVSPIDNVNREWVPPYFPVTNQTNTGCNFCHGVQYKDWKDTLMAQSASPTNAWVRSLYGPSDQGPSYRSENPDKAGPCANCHAPAAAIDAPNETVLSEVTGVAESGVFCEVCHSVREVKDIQKPGVAGSLVLSRASAWTQFFAYGPYDDAASAPMTTAYNPLFKEARLCAGCHEWTTDLGVPVLSTYTEWSEMSGADPDALTCQDCHMRKKFGTNQTVPDPTLTYVLDNSHMAGMYGNLRPKDTLSPHVFRGGLDYAPEAADIWLTANQSGGEFVVDVLIANVNAGHALPTGMPFRHAILVVDAKVQDQPAQLLDGSTVPDYGGEGDSPRDYAGKPGRGYAKVLGDGTGARNVLFWRATEVIEDTRIRAGQKELAEFRFGVPADGGPVTVKATLIYRRAFIDLARAKGWDMEDIVIAQKDVSLTLTPPPPPRTEPEPEPTTQPEPTDPGSDCSCDASEPSSVSGPPGILIAATLLLRPRKRTHPRGSTRCQVR